MVAVVAEVARDTKGDGGNESTSTAATEPGREESTGGGVGEVEEAQNLYVVTCAAARAVHVLLGTFLWPPVVQ